MKKFLPMAVLLCAATAAQAGLTVNFDNSTVSGGVYTYEYLVSQATDDEVRTGDFFTLYDFNGLVVAAPDEPSGPADWSPTWSFVGVNSPWVRFTYDGAPALTDNLVGSFFISSTIGPNMSPNIAWQGTNYSDEGLPVGSFGNTFGPGADNPVPEPATMGLMGGALLGLGMFARRRK